MTGITKDDATAIASAAVKQAFTEMGIHGSPEEMQRDMAHLRDSRRRHESIVNRIFSYGITGLILGSMAMTWKDAFAHIFKSSGGQ